MKYKLVSQTWIDPLLWLSTGAGGRHLQIV